ncbi:MAG TPA: efflux RND transporter periplasmic adaptor subunit [Gallionella sp.]|nr:efflux RND transporter periplasmic adaptor subunit [Gallionella sp.]
MSDQDSTATSATPGKRRVILLLITGSVLVILLAVFAWWFFIGQWRTSTDDAYVGGNIVAVMPMTGGTVIAIHGDTTQAVTEGQLLVQLDDSDAHLQLDAAEAALATAVREVRGLYATSHGNLPLLAQRRADLARVQAELARSDATLAQAESEYKRRVALAQQNFVSPENVQIAQTVRDAARAQRDAAASAVQASSAAIAQTVDQASVSSARVDHTSLENHPDVRTAAVRVREATLALARTRVLAPVSGQVAKRSVQIGERVVPGAALMAIVPLDKVWLDANFKETELTDARIGQPARLTSDFYGGSVVFHGHVLGLAPGTGSAFALLPAQNATGNWVKIVQRLPVRIALDAKELQAHPLRIGLSMDATIDTHDRSGAALTTLPNTAAIAATAVYAQDIKAADARVAQIIADNLERK